MLSETDALRMNLENRRWSKELRLCMAALVNSRMANQISHEEYTARRVAAKHERVECDRRAAVLSN